MRHQAVQQHLIVHRWFGCWRRFLNQKFIYSLVFVSQVSNRHNLSGCYRERKRGSENMPAIKNTHTNTHARTPHFTNTPPSRRTQVHKRSRKIQKFNFMSKHVLWEDKRIVPTRALRIPAKWVCSKSETFSLANNSYFAAQLHLKLARIKENKLHFQK